MQSVKVELEVGKELKEATDFIVAVISHIKAGKELSELLALWPAGLEAVKGFDQFDDEAKSKLLGPTVGYLSSELLKALLK